ncbi:MAG: carbohydrate-binding protein [Spirochaetales bacterium]|nr:carbohydrate-binding protein [Spirochaetales bacterium]
MSGGQGLACNSFSFSVNAGGGGTNPTSTPTPTPVPQANTTTPPPTTNNSIPGLIEAENYSNMSGIQTEACSEGGLNVGWIEAGDWMDYNVNVASTGSYTVQYRVASLSSTISFSLREGNSILGSVSTGSTGGWQTWTTVSHTVNLSAGSRTLRVYADGGGWNINWLNFTSSGGSVPTATPTPVSAATATPVPAGNTPTPTSRRSGRR